VLFFYLPSVSQLFRIPVAPGPHWPLHYIRPALKAKRPGLFSTLYLHKMTQLILYLYFRPLKTSRQTFLTNIITTTAIIIIIIIITSIVRTRRLWRWRRRAFGNNNAVVVAAGLASVWLLQSASWFIPGVGRQWRAPLLAFARIHVHNNIHILYV